VPISAIGVLYLVVLNLGLFLGGPIICSLPVGLVVLYLAVLYIGVPCL
jgi:hypothetical protein